MNQAAPPPQPSVSRDQERPLRLRRNIYILTTLWTTVIVLSLLVNLNHAKEEVRQWARRQADFKYDDILGEIRTVAGNATVHDGDDAEPATSQTMSVLLRSVRNLPIFTHNKLSSSSLIRIHVFSPTPLDRRNLPGDWELTGFKSLSRGEPAAERETMEPLNGRPERVLQQLRPLYLDKDCQRCHNDPEFSAGTLYGGLSLMIPLSQAAIIEADESLIFIFGHAILWLIGLGGLWLFARSLRDRLSEREENKGALQRERDFIAAVIDTAGALVVVLDGQGRVVRFNRACERTSGYSAAEVLGKKLWHLPLLPPEETQGVEAAFLDLASQDPAAARARDMEGFWVTKEGKKRFISWSVTCLRNGGAGVEHVISVGIDSTERRQIEQSLRTSEEKFRVLFEDCYDAIFIINAESGRIVDVNRAATLLMGIPRGGLVGLHHTRLHPPEEADKYRIHFTAPSHTESPLLDCAIQRADGRHVPVEISVAHFCQGGETFIQGVFRDVSERKRAEEERQRLEDKIQHTQKLESLGVLAGGIAHDFNNLLMGMLGHADLVLMDLPADSPSRYNVQQIVTASLRAADLTRQMLAYSGKGKFVIELLDLTRLVEEMTHLLQVSISKKIVLRFNFAPGLPSIQGDATQMRQIVMNLITNASDAIGEQSGVITIATRVMEVDRAYLQTTYMDDNLPPGFYACVEVSDTGCGMDAETQARIFDPFFTTKFTGRGLGLAAVLGIVRGHHGGIKVYSEPGSGTTFKVLFPCHPESVAVHAAVLSHDGLVGQGSGTVLVVDDEETVRTVGKMALELAGFQVLTAADGREALEIFREQEAQIDLVLLDMTMPHLNGEEVFREMRRIRPDVRIILSSGYNEQEATDRFAGKGLSGFIQKPYRTRELIDKILALQQQDE